MTKWDGAFRDIRRRSIQGVQASIGVATPFAFQADQDTSDVPDFVDANWDALGSSTETVLSLPARDMNLVRDTLIAATKFFHLIECARSEVARGAMTWAVVDAYHACFIGARAIFALYGILSYQVRGRTILVDFRPEFGSKDEAKKFSKLHRDVSEPVRILRPQVKYLEQSDAWALLERLCNVTECPPEDTDFIAALGEVATRPISEFRNSMLYDSVAWRWPDDFSPKPVAPKTRLSRLDDTASSQGATVQSLVQIFEFSRDRVQDLCHHVGYSASSLSPVVAKKPTPADLLC